MENKCKKKLPRCVTVSICTHVAPPIEMIGVTSNMGRVDPFPCHKAKTLDAEVGVMRMFRASSQRENRIFYSERNLFYSLLSFGMCCVGDVPFMLLI